MKNPLNPFKSETLNPFKSENNHPVWVHKVRVKKRYGYWSVQFKTKKDWFWKNYGDYLERDAALSAAAEIYRVGSVRYFDTVSSVEATLS
jgi:hypothetical protein